MGWRKLKKHCLDTGYTEDAIYSKIKRGDLPQGIVWIKAPDGKILISEEGFEKWALGMLPANTKASARDRNRRLKLISTTTESAANRASKPSPRLPTFDAPPHLDAI